MIRYYKKIKYISQNRKQAFHLIFHTKRFGVNNERWSDFDSMFGIPTWDIVWNIIKIRPVIESYRFMKWRAKYCYILTNETLEILGWERK